MTRDEVLAMKPGRELDALVAGRVMGWRVFETKLIKDGYVAYLADFNPSTNIAAAWEVVEKLHSTGKYNLALEYYPNEKDWGADFDEWGISSQAVAVTAQEAIVKAALLAVMEL
jgi:hypothetical protein